MEECVSQLIEATEVIYEMKELFGDWRSTIGNLMKMNAREVNGDDKSASVEALSRSEEKTILYLLEALKIDLIDKNYYLHNVKSSVLLKNSIKYLTKFIDREELN